MQGEGNEETLKTYRSNLGMTFAGPDGEMQADSRQRLQMAGWLLSEMIDLKQLGYEQLAALLANVISCMHQLKYEEGKINICLLYTSDAADE